jgi:hypothetical protein
MNKLDDKVIVDRKTLVELDKFARKLGYDRHKPFAKLNKALATDLTGWAAVRVDASDEERMLPAPWRYPLLLRGWHYMLAASPPLPGGGK